MAGSASQDVDDQFDPEILMAYDILDAAALAERQRVRDDRTTAERAQEDRLWSYGHVVVDEAQELSAMEWRMVMRRCPNHWMTLVGDTAQTGSPAGVESWSDMLEPFVQSRWHHHRLTINYRTPKEITDVVDHIRHHVAPDTSSDTAIRSNGRHPTMVYVPELDSCRATNAEATHHDLVDSDSGRGQSPVIEKLQLVIADVARAISAERTIAIVTAANNPDLHFCVNEAVHRLDPDQSVSILNPSETKGLEFDEVIIVEPEDIVYTAVQGFQDLYVAATRATQGLTVMYSGHPIFESA